MAVSFCEIYHKVTNFVLWIFNIFFKWYTIFIDQGGEWLWQKVLNIHSTLKKMQYSFDLTIRNYHFAMWHRILESVNPH